MPTMIASAMLATASVALGAAPYLPPAAEIRPATADAGDHVGIAVDLDGDTAIVGAWLDDDLGLDVGAAFLYDTTDPRAPALIAELAPVAPSVATYFGYDVAIDGGLALVGAWGADDEGYATGSVCVFDAATGQRLARFTADDARADRGFGWSVALDGDLALVGAIGDGGAAYLFDLSDPEAPVQLAKLLPTDDGNTFEFGFDVALSGDRALVGAPGDRTNGVDAGAAFVFDIADPAAPSLIATLRPDDAAERQRFGDRVAIDGPALALVAAPGDDDAAGDAGAVYFYNPTSLEPGAKITAPDATPNDAFGSGIAVNDDVDIAVIGASGAEARAYLVGVSDPEFPFVDGPLLRPGDGPFPGDFGFAVATTADAAIIGAPTDDLAGDEAGAAFLFDLGATLACRADINDDDATNVFDFARLADAFGATPDDPHWDPDADLNGDERVTFLDFNLLIEAFGCRVVSP